MKLSQLQLKWGRAGARKAACAVLISALSAAGVSAAASQPPVKDLPGIISQKDLQSGMVALQPADVQFYIKIEQAALDRYQHPKSNDLSDIAEGTRVQRLEMAALAKNSQIEAELLKNEQEQMQEAIKTGKKPKAVAEPQLYSPTKEQDAAVARGAALQGGVAAMLAAEAGMPSEQWSQLSDKVEHAAGLLSYAGGSGDDGPVAKLTAEQQARADGYVRIRGVDKKLLAPHVAEITRLKNLMESIITDRVQKANLP